MRRKNFIFTAGLIVLLVFLNAAGIPLRQSRLSDLSESEEVLSGKVTKLKISDEGEYRMEVRVSRAAGKSTSALFPLTAVYAPHRKNFACFCHTAGIKLDIRTPAL